MCAIMPGMSLHEQLKKELPEAMKTRDAERLRAVRNLLAAFTNELVAKRMKPQEILPDDLCLAVIKRMVKQRKDSIAQFREGGREDLVTSEESELAYLQKFLPEEAGEEEIRAIVLKKKEELGIKDKAQMGMLMSAVMKELEGKADGNAIKKIAEETF